MISVIFTTPPPWPPVPPRSPTSLLVGPAEQHTGNSTEPTAGTYREPTPKTTAYLIVLLVFFARGCCFVGAELHFDFPLRLSPRPTQPKPVVLLQEFLLHTPIRLTEERIGKKLKNLIYHRFDHNMVKQWTKR